MTSIRSLLVPIVIAAGVAACSIQPEPPSVPATVRTPQSVESPNGVLAPTRVSPEVATPPTSPPPPEVLAALVRQSPCDILPETEATVGTLAHDRGYPRWRHGDITYDEASPQRVPDPHVVYALTGGNTYENEVHDCQRLVLIEGADSSFGPLVGLLPLDPAMDLADADFVSGVAVASVYNWGDFDGAAQRYPELAIGASWNCLWLRNDGGTTWRAAMTPDEPRACFDRPPPDPSAYTLDVQRAEHHAFIPRTARWGWDASSAVHVMGIKCGSAWCSIGPANLWSSDVIRLQGDARSSIPGYFDEQHLALPEGTDSLKPGPVGVLTPTAAFYNLSELQRVFHDLDWFTFLMSQGIPVATIELRGWRGRATPEPYATRWGVAQSPVNAQRPVRVGFEIEQGRLVSTFRNRDGRWGRSVEPVSTHGASHAAIGAVRWRWHDTANTASLWSACGSKGMDCCDTR